MEINAEKGFEYRQFFEQTPDYCIIASEEGKIIKVNPAWLRRLGMEEKEVVSRQWLDFIHPDDRERTVDAAEAGYPNGISNFEIRVMMKDRSAIWTSWSTTGWKDGLTFVIGRDIDKQVKEKEMLLILSGALAHIGDTVVITDPDGKIVYVNPAFEQKTGYSKDEVLGQNPRMLKSGNRPAEFYQGMWATIKRGEPWHAEFINRRKDSTLYIEDKVINPIFDEKKQITHFVAIGRDTTMRKKELEQLKSRTEEVERINKLMIGREMKMAELKKEIEELKRKGTG